MLFTRRETLLLLAQAGRSETWTIQEASRQIRRRALSPVELTRWCLDRIEKLNPRLNAYITVMAESAMAQARALERAPARGPLHGIPIGLKDLVDTAGVKTTCASALYQDRVPAEDADVSRRLKAAGAVIVGKHNMHEFAYGSTSAPSHYGPVRNPWNVERIPGGSSGGTAAAVAAGMCLGGIGSDTGGSIRQPSAYCGIVGLKPTYGRVSTRGVVPLAWSRDHIGPMCRTVEDTALVLQAIAGYDPAESTSVDAPVADYRKALGAKTGSLRIGVPRAYFFEGLDAEIEKAVAAALDVIGRLAGSVRDVKLPPIEPLPITSAEAWAYHAASVTKSPE
ncbi:MAG: amidase, partial [Bryobacteraceae bacterium]